jgi:hypothetical protein
VSRDYSEFGRPPGSRMFRNIGAFLFLTSFSILASCERAGTDVTSKTSALVGDPIESITQTQGAAPVQIFLGATADASVQKASFSINVMDVADCQARHPPSTQPFAAPNCGDNRDDGNCGFFRCLIMADLALNPYYVTGDQNPNITASYEDISVVEVVVNVGQTTTLHWEWIYTAWHESFASSFQLDLVSQDGSTTHLIQPVTAPEGWTSLSFTGPQGIFSTGQNSNDLELSRFWPSQKVRLRFILRNTFKPSFGNIVIGAWPLEGLDATGTCDLGLATLAVNNLKINTDECPVSPLPALDSIAQQFEDGNNIDISDLDPRMQTALSCLEAALGTNDSIVNSAFRPPSYQQHLYDVHQRWLELENNTDPACADLKASIQAEELKHALVRSGAAPGNVGAHTKGLALDLKGDPSVLVPAACTCGLYRKYAPAAQYKGRTTGRIVIDPPHYELKPAQGQPCL